MNHGGGIKWVNVPEADATAVGVARRTLKARLKHVQEMLSLAVAQYPGDTAPVHRLRVGCRRASAALEAFRPLMSCKPKAMRKWLRRIRRAAGPAREADVLLQRFAEQEDGDSCAELIFHQLQQDRSSAQRLIVKTLVRVQSGKWRRSVDRCLESFSATDAQPFQEFATSRLDSVKREFLELTQRKHPTIDQLHELRIAGKRLRYSIELFHSALPSSLRYEVYPQVVQLQSRLGKLNDHVSAQALFQSWLAGMVPGERAKQVAQQILQERQAAVEAQAEFLQWWTSQRCAWLSHTQ